MSVTLLPNELITLILKNNDCADIIHFGSTCKYFNNMIRKNQYLWKEKFKNLTPKHMFDIMSTYNCDWFKEIKFFYNTKNKIHFEIASMSSKHQSHDDEDQFDLQSVYDIALSNSVSYYYTVYILQDLIKKGHQFLEQKLCVIPYTLTEMYYARVVLLYLMYMFLTIKWIQMRKKGQLGPENVFSLFIQWIDVMNIHCDKAIDEKISGIVKEVEELLNIRNPALSQSTLPLKEKVAQELINKKKVLEAIIDVIYCQRGMRTTTSWTLNTLVTEQVLNRKEGNTITVAVIYYCVAKECGVQIDLICFPQHFFLKWQDNSDTLKRKYTLDMSVGGLRLQKQCPFRPRQQLGYYNYQPENLLRCLIDSYLQNVKNTSFREEKHMEKLLNLVQDRIDTNMYYRYKCLLGNVKSFGELPDIDINYMDDDHIKILTNLTSLTRVNQLGNAPKIKLVRKVRDSHVKYAIGMICYHKALRYNCIIIGWDPICDQKRQSWIVATRNELEKNQPFYTVTCEDLSLRYVPQEDLVHVTVLTSNIYYEDQVSRYFTHFNGFAYVPNKEKQDEYPDDINISEMYRAKLQNMLGIDFDLKIQCN